ncbi:hypothetical protein JMM81_15815 [Bacillus sp. V3B]|uniref:hypothetical protein n=1 Tax=Bacillus sp. V3B TaxID=2804915 RepID=UPI00210CEE1C|nr:hypothetical protein [Bacillus sp. V3B]MCQ6276382.1 hypothetical protein [Bacillus sp. V3B]
MIIRMSRDEAKDLYLLIVSFYFAYKSVIVLGHPEYDSKLDFKKASSWGIKASFEVWDESFRTIE